MHPRNVNDMVIEYEKDYLEELYYIDNRAYTYTESFLKMFYLILGQAYSRGYIDLMYYDRLCKNKETTK